MSERFQHPHMFWSDEVLEYQETIERVELAEKIIGKDCVEIFCHESNFGPKNLLGHATVKYIMTLKSKYMFLVMENNKSGRMNEKYRLDVLYTEKDQPEIHIPQGDSKVVFDYVQDILQRDAHFQKSFDAEGMKNLKEWLWREVIMFFLFSVHQRLPEWEEIWSVPLDILEKELKAYLWEKGKVYAMAEESLPDRFIENRPITRSMVVESTLMALSSVFTFYMYGFAEWLADLNGPKTTQSIEEDFGYFQSEPKLLADQGTGHVEVNGHPLYQTLQVALSSGNFKTNGESIYPIANLGNEKGTVKATAQLRAFGRNDDTLLFPDELGKAQQKIAEYLLAMDDLTADVQDIISARWLLEAEHPEALITLTADDFLLMRGKKPQLNGAGRRGGYKREWRREISRQIEILQNTWLTVDEMIIPVEHNGRTRFEKFTSEGPALIVTQRRGQPQMFGQFEAFAWRLRPGDMFSKVLFGPGRQTALLALKALNYDPYHQQIHKKMTRWLSWQWGNSQGTGEYTRIEVKKILEITNQQLDRSNPYRTEARHEKVWDTLAVDGVIGGWQYESIEGKWINRKVLFTPPPEVIALFSQPRIEATTKTVDKASFDGEELKRIRLERKLTQERAANDIGISQPTLSKIERGKQVPDEETLQKILAWVG